MIEYKLHRDPYDADEILFTGKLTRSIKPGITILTGCNGSGKTTILNEIEYKYANNNKYKLFTWNGLVDKKYAKDTALESGEMSLLASLAFSSEGEEIDINIGVLARTIGRFVAANEDKDLIILLDALDSGLSIDNIVEIKTFFKDMLIPDIEKMGHNCYVLIPANEYEMARGERCVDARTGKELIFGDYEEYRNYILKSRKVKDKRYHQN